MPSATDNSPSPVSLHDAIEALQAASKLPAKQRTTNVSSVIGDIAQHAFEHGLDAPSLADLVQLVVRKNHLDQTSVTNLVKNLYPAQRVSEEVVVAVVGSLGQGKGKPSAATQNGLVKWLIIVHEILEDPKILSRLYGVLFGLLDMMSLRTSLCHLLSLVTRRRHVKPFRIQQLLELSRGISNEPALQGLLRVYKDYYPDIILGNASATKGSFPPRPDPEWQARLTRIRDAHHRATDDGFEHRSGFRVLRKDPKRRKASVIPDVHTFYSTETSVTLEEIDSVDDFVDKLELIELPGQLLSFLTDPLLQKYLTLNPSAIASRRIDLWLTAYLDAEYDSLAQGLGTSSQLSELLDALFILAWDIKTILPITLTFLKAYMPLWDGLTDAASILGILSRLPFQPFSGVFPTYLKPAEDALIKGNPEAQQKIISMYANLFQHWCAQASIRANGVQLSAVEQKHFVDLITHVSELCLSVLSTAVSPSDCPAISSVLTFFESVSASSVPKTIPIILAPPHVVYLLLMQPSLTTLERTCGILANYKNSFDNHPTPISAYYPTALTNRFNGYLMDACNLLWRSRALMMDANSLGFYCEPVVREALNTYLLSMDREYTLSSAFGLSHNPLLASLSASAWRLLEETVIQREGFDGSSVTRHKGPVTQRSLTVLAKDQGVDVAWKQYRVYVLKWLNERGSPGVKNLMFTTMVGLKETVVP